MSRSCQSGTFSRPTTAAARTTRASPQMRSATFGLRLCGIADEPFIPFPNGSSTSRTSVRARCLISVANRSSDVAQSASAASISACRSRAITCVDSGSGSRPSFSQAIRSTSGSTCAYVPTVPDSCPTRFVSSAAANRVRARSSSNAHPASFQPKVIGSAWIPCDLPMQTVFRCSSARAVTRARARSIPSRTRTPASWICRESAVSTTSDDVRPKWTQRPSGPSCSVTASTKAAVSWSVTRSISATRSGVGTCARARIAATSSAGIAPTSAHASSAASSTSNQRASLLSSDQILVMAGRE